MVLATLIAVVFADRWGRHALFLSGESMRVPGFTALKQSFYWNYVPDFGSLWQAASP